MLQENPLVAIMIPCFNSAESLSRALASLISQTYSNWKCLVVDDASDDHPENVVSAFDDSRIMIHRFESNRGRGHARQFALESLEGDFLGFLDADDWYYPTKLEKQLEAFAKDPSVSIVSCTMSLTDSDGDLMGKTVAGDGSISTGLIRGVAPLQFHAAPSLIRMEVAQAGSYRGDLLRAQDFDFFLNIGQGKRFSVINEPLYVYPGWNEVPLSKMITSLRYERRVYRLHLRSDVVGGLKGVTSTAIRQILYIMLFLTNNDGLLVKRRMRSSTPREIDAFKEALAQVEAHVSTSGRRDV